MTSFNDSIRRILHKTILDNAVFRFRHLVQLSFRSSMQLCSNVRVHAKCSGMFTLLVWNPLGGV